MRHRYRGRQKVDILKTLLFLLLATYAALVVIHLANGLGLGASMSGGVIDARVAISCPEKPRLIWDFINRSVLLDYAMRVAVQFGGNYGEICQLENISELTR